MKESTTVRMNINDLIPADYNPRKISVKAFNGLKESIKRFGEMGGIVYNQRTKRLVGGHQRVKALKQLGYKEIEVKVVDMDESEEKMANISLNNESIMGEFDDSQLQKLFDDLSTDLNFDQSIRDLQLESLFAPEIEDKAQKKPEEIKYTEKKYTPIYEPSSTKPDIKDIFSTEKRDRLIEEIDKADLPEDIRSFLCSAAERHTKFNFAKIADYYAHSSKQIQELFEHSALVIIDVDDAIANGYVELENKIRNFHMIEDNAARDAQQEEEEYLQEKERREEESEDS